MSAAAVEPSCAAWYAWGAVTVATFAILETRGLKNSSGRDTTLSHTLRKHVRPSRLRRAGFVAVAGWVAYHIVWESA